MNNVVMNVVTFESTHHAIAGEKYIKEKGLNTKTIPTPREITASCGLSIKFEIQDLKQIEEIINQHKLKIEGIYSIEIINDIKVANKIR